MHKLMRAKSTNIRPNMLIAVDCEQTIKAKKGLRGTNLAQGGIR